MSSESDIEKKQLNGLQLAVLGVCTFVFVVVGGMLVLAGGGGLKPAAQASQAGAVSSR